MREIRCCPSRSCWRCRARPRADEADAHYRAGLAYKQQNKTDEAIQEFLEALKLRHDYAAAEFSLGVTYKMRNQLDLRPPSTSSARSSCSPRPPTATPASA